MKIPILIAVACSVVLSMDGLAKLDEDSKFNVLDFVDKNSRRSYAAASISARNIVKKHSEPIDEYMGLFDYPIQAANGCITRNKLRGLDPVECITMVTNPVTNDTLRFHESYRQPFTNAQLEVLIFNAIEIRNIPVLNELLQIRLFHGAIEWIYLQNAYCWALISENEISIDAPPMPHSIADFQVNEACDLLNTFAVHNGYETAPKYSVTLDVVTIFQRSLAFANWQLNYLFDCAYFRYGTCKDALVSRPYPTSRFKFYTYFFCHEDQSKCLKELLENGALIQKGNICSSLNRFDRGSVISYLKSGMLVDWDFEMNCIAKVKSSVYGSSIRIELIHLTIREMERQFSPKTVPLSLYHGLKVFNV